MDGILFHVIIPRNKFLFLYSDPDALSSRTNQSSKPTLSRLTNQGEEPPAATPTLVQFDWDKPQEEVHQATIDEVRFVCTKFIKFIFNNHLFKYVYIGNDRAIFD